jgi:hypothetical protein
MSASYNSLMLDAPQGTVQASTELAKVRQVGEQLLAFLGDVPSFKEMTRDRLALKVLEYNVALNAENIFITRGAYTAEQKTRPSGTLLDVFFECLAKNISPNYIFGVDGVYTRPNTTNNAYAVQGLSIQSVERILVKAISDLRSEHRASVDRYWLTNAGVIDNPASTNKDVLKQLQAHALMAQLSLSTIGGVLDSSQGRRVSELLLSGKGTALYRIVLEVPNKIPATFPSSFVVNMNGLTPSELSLDDDWHTCVVYTPESGFEFFVTSNDMHAALCSRWSVSKTSVSYKNVQEDIFEFCVDSRLKQQRDDFSRLLNFGDSHSPNLLVELEATQRLDAVKSNWTAQFEVLKAAVNRAGWPDWLKASDKNVQLRYEELEESADNYDAEFQVKSDEHFSLTLYARRKIKDWARSAFGVEINPDTIKVHSRYELKIGGRTIVQEDARTLTEQIIFGLHDGGHRVQMRFEGAQAIPGLTPEKLEYWLQTVDVRRDFVEAAPFYPSQAYHDACLNRLSSKLELALWIARYTGKINDNDVRLVERGLQGELAVEINGVYFDGASHCLNDVMLFWGAQKSFGTQLVFLKTPKGEYEVLRFAEFNAFKEKLGEWMNSDSGYAASLMNANDVPSVGERLRQHVIKPILSNLKSMVLNRETRIPLTRFVGLNYDWSLARINQAAPAYYRNVPRLLRQQHARLNTELKALYTVESRETAFPSFEEYSRELIKERVEAVLRSRGSYVNVDPDMVYVQISSDEQMSLTELIVEGRSFEPNNSPQPVPGQYPKFYWRAVHPPLDKLDIRDIASWSKTLRSGEKYIDFLKSDYLAERHSSYTFRREVNFKRVHCEMHQALLTQFFDAGLDGDQFRSVEKLILDLKVPQGQLYENPVVNEESVYRFNILKTREVAGVYIFRIKTAKGLEDFLYTPDAPDGAAFRPIGHFASAVRLRFGPFRSYYINRIKVADKKVVNDYFDLLQSRADTVAAPVPSYMSRVRDLRASYEIKVNRVIDDVDEQTTSLNEIIAGLIYDNVMLAATVISLVIPPVGVLVTIVELGKNFYDGVKAHYYGDYDASFKYFKDALIGLVSLGQATRGAKVVTNAQKSLIQLFGDAKTVVSMVSKATGQKLGHERLLEIVQDVLGEQDVNTSKTTVH